MTTYEVLQQSRLIVVLSQNVAGLPRVRAMRHTKINSEFRGYLQIGNNHARKGISCLHFNIMRKRP